MKNLELKHTTLRLPIKYIRTIENSGMQVSEYIRELLDSHFSEMKVISDIEECEEKLKTLKVIQETIMDQTNIKKLSPEEKDWLFKSSKVIERNPQFLMGQFNLWKTTFQKDFGVTPERFRELLIKVKGDINGCP